MLLTRNIENWDTAMYVVSMCMHCYHRLDINQPCFICSVQICDHVAFSHGHGCLFLHIPYNSVLGKHPWVLEHNS